MQAAASHLATITLMSQSFAGKVSDCKIMSEGSEGRRRAGGALTNKTPLRGEGGTD